MVLEGVVLGIGAGCPAGWAIGQKTVSTGSFLSLCTFHHQVSSQGCSCFS
jgi:hypothetical protein